MKKYILMALIVLILVLSGCKSSKIGRPIGASPTPVLACPTPTEEDNCTSADCGGPCAVVEGISLGAGDLMGMVACSEPECNVSKNFQDPVTGVEFNEDCEFDLLEPEICAVVDTMVGSTSFVFVRQTKCIDPDDVPCERNISGFDEPVPWCPAGMGIDWVDIVQAYLENQGEPCPFGPGTGPSPGPTDRPTPGPTDRPTPGPTDRPTPGASPGPTGSP